MVTVDCHSTSLLIMVSKLGTVTLYTWLAVVSEIALYGWHVTFCPPLKTWNFTLGVMHPRRSSFYENLLKSL